MADINSMKKTVFQFGFRKVLSVGYSLLIPLPKEWTRNVNAGKGDKLRIEMLEDHSLRISPVNAMETQD